MMVRSLMIFLSIIFFMGFASASFSVDTVYSDNYPLVIGPGEIVESDFILHNLPDDESVSSVKAEIIEGEEFLEDFETELIYEIAPDEKVNVPVRISAPLDSLEGEKFDVVLKFVPTIDSEVDGSVGFRLNVVKKLPILVGLREASVGEEEADLLDSQSELSGQAIVTGTIIVLALAILAVIILLIVYSRRKNKKIQYSST